MASHKQNNGKKSVVLALPAFSPAPEKRRSRVVKNGGAPCDKANTLDGTSGLGDKEEAAPVDAVMEEYPGQRDQLIDVPITHGIKQALGKFVPVDDNVMDNIFGTKNTPGFTQQDAEGDNKENQMAEIHTSFGQQPNTKNNVQKIQEEPLGFTQQQQDFTLGGSAIPEKSTDPDNVFEYALKNSIMDLE